jgi:Flp pilus assembly protein TadD
VRLGDLLGRLNRRSEAAAAYQHAIDAPDQSGAPALWGLYMLKGGALAQQGDWEAGRAALRKALELGPDQPAALNFLGYSMLERRENIPEALRLVAKASAIRPDDVAITDSLGWAYFLSGDYEKAVSTLEMAVDLEPIEPTIGEHLGDAYWRAGRRVDARYTWRAALLLAEGSDVARLENKIDTGLTDTNMAR